MTSIMVLFLLLGFAAHMRFDHNDKSAWMLVASAVGYAMVIFAMWIKQGV